MNKLDSNNLTGQQTITKSDYNDIVNYLQWCETLASLVLENVLSLHSIDALFSYRFFLIVNHPQIQKKEIIPSKEYYRGIYLLYNKWETYKKKLNLKILNEETALSKTEGFENFIKSIQHKKIKIIRRKYVRLFCR